MKQRFCDEGDACTLLRQATRAFLIPHPTAPAFEVDVRSHKGGYFRVTLHYCPFCGSRIHPKTVEGARGARR